MKKILFALLLLAGGTCGLHAQKFALVDMEYIMGNIPEIGKAHV